MRISPSPLFFILLVCLAAIRLDAQNAAAETTAKIGEIEAKFQSAYDRDVGGPHASAVAALDVKYLGAVNRALEAATQAGGLDEALKLREEVQRLTTKSPLPPVDLDTLPAGLKQLRTTYRAALAKLEQDRDAKSQPYYDHYDKLLDSLQADLTKAKRIDDAVMVKIKRESVALDRPKIAKPASPADVAESPAPKSDSQSKRPTSNSAVALKGSPWRTAAEWALSLKARLQIEKDGRRGIEKAELLPVGKFDILSIEFSRYYPHDGKKMNEVDLALLNPIAKTLERLILDQCNITGTGLEAIAGAPKLRQISFHESPVTDDSMKHLSGLMELERIDVNGAKMDGTGLAHLRALPKLKELELNASALSEQGGKALAMLTRLEKLSGGTGSYRGDGLAFTQHLTSLVNLRELTFGDTAPITDQCLEPLKNLTRLERVNFSNSQISGTGLAHLKASAATLKYVSLWYQCPVTDEAVLTIVATLPNLTDLGIGNGGRCGADALRSLASLKGLLSLGWASKVILTPTDYALFAALPSLERLNFNGNTVVNDDSLSSLISSKKIKTLLLEGVPITDAGLAHLKGMKSLQTLSVRGSKVTDQGVADFKRARPDVKVEK